MIILHAFPIHKRDLYKLLLSGNIFSSVNVVTTKKDNDKYTNKILTVKKAFILKNSVTVPIS